MRREDLTIVNLENEEQVEKLRSLLAGIVGVEFVGADLESQVVEFDIYQDLDDLTITDIQCMLREAGFEAGEVVEGQTCRLRFRRK